MPLPACHSWILRILARKIPTIIPDGPAHMNLKFIFDGLRADYFSSAEYLLGHKACQGFWNIVFPSPPDGGDTSEGGLLPYDVLTPPENLLSDDDDIANGQDALDGDDTFDTSDGDSLSDVPVENPYGSDPPPSPFNMPSSPTYSPPSPFYSPPSPA